MSLPDRKTRAPTATSAISFSNMELAHVGGLKEHPMSSTANYDPALWAMIQEGLTNNLISSKAGICPSVTKLHLDEPSVRPVQFHPNVVKRQSRKFNFLAVTAVAAFGVQRSGYDVREPCRECSRGRGIFQGCVIADGYSNGACANCAYSTTRATKCSFRRDTKDPLGHVAAQRITPRVPLSCTAKPTAVAGQHDIYAESMATPSSARSPSTSDGYDFVFSTTSSGSSKSPTRQSSVLMSGGLGPDGDPAHGHAVPTPEARQTSVGKLRRIRRERAERAERIEETRRMSRHARSPSVEFLSASPVVVKPLRHGKENDKATALQSSDLLQWMARERKKRHTSEATMVDNASSFKPGEMTEAQFWYVVDCCNIDNLQVLQNQYRWCRSDCRIANGMEYDRSFYEHFLWEDPYWFRKKVIRIVCPPPAPDRCKTEKFF